jgi:glycosyltransferase involved in cell wall biosynthesis
VTRSVAFVLPSLAGGGAERVTLALAGGLDRTKFTPHLILFERVGPLAGSLPGDVAVTSFERQRLRHARPDLIVALQALRPDAVVSTFGYVNLALLAARRRLPGGTRLILREANLPSLSLHRGRFGWLMAMGYRRWYRHADQLIASSERMAGEFAERLNVPRSKIVVLPNPVDEAALRGVAAKPVRSPGAGRRFVAAGRLVAQKGFDRLIDMFAELPDDTELTILGDGPERAKLAHRAAARGLANRVALPGFLPEPWPHYAGADAFLMPSRWEGMPNAALEALACGTPVIATPESGGIAELVAAAPVGAVTVVEAGPPFIAAMRAVESEPPAARRPSLLPAKHRLDAVVAAFEAILTESDA